LGKGDCARGDYTAEVFIHKKLH